MSQVQFVQYTVIPWAFSHGGFELGLLGLEA